MTPTHYTGSAYPTRLAHFDWGWLRRTKWRVWTRDGSPGSFTSWWFVGHLQFYHGDAKLDGSMSLRYSAPIYTDVPKELLAFRWRSARPSPPDPFNMGGT